MPTKDACTEVTKDRAGSKSLVDVFSLGDIRLNAFLRPDEPDPPAYPLTLAYAPESGLLQLRHSVDPELMFRTYWYNSGTNEAMVQHLKGVADDAQRHVRLEPKDVVVDIGCNDGTMFQQFPDWVYTVGYDPAQNLKPDCDLFINDFFKPEPYGGTKRAKVVTSIAMFYDVEDPVTFARQVRSIMDDNGIWIIEMHYLPEMLRKNEVDAICHEHICYYSLTALCYVLREAGLSVVDVSFNDVNGGSMRAIVKPAGRASAPSPLMQNTLNAEARTDWPFALNDFARRIEQNADRLVGMLTRLASQNKEIWGYGASTKGNTLLQYANIGKNILPNIADRNPQKHGLETVGTRIPIVSEEDMRAWGPEYLLALPYHFIDNFRQREGDRFTWIVPVPEPQILR